VERSNFAESNAKRLKNIRKNKKDEKEALREQEAWDLRDTSSNNGAADVIKLKKESGVVSSRNKKHLDLLKESRENE